MPEGNRHLNPPGSRPDGRAAAISPAGISAVRRTPPRLATKQMRTLGQVQQQRRQGTRRSSSSKSSLICIIPSKKCRDGQLDLVNGRPVCIGQCHEDSRLHRTRRFDRLNRVGRGGLVSTRHFRGPKTACGRWHKLAIGLNSRSAIRDWGAITNRISDAARIAKRASDQNRGIGSSARLESVRFSPTGLGALGLLGWRRKRKAQA
jgi:hypothetical protein